MSFVDRAWSATIQARWVWWLGVAAAVAIAAYIIWGQLAPTEASSDVPVVYIDSATGPCPPERWDLACRRLEDRGWSCGTGPGGVPVRAMTDADCSWTALECRGGHRQEDYRDAIGIVPWACGDDDPTPEHEALHIVLGEAGDCPGCPSGDVRAPWPRTGLRIPERAP